MTCQLRKPVAKAAGCVIFGAINGAIYGSGWVLMRIDDLSVVRRRAWNRLIDEYRCRRVGTRTEQWLKDGAR
ncbi:hypothetical protein A5717_26150 [Mycolicibacterium porcinum]|uniref:hypothetical protein n=1 Tax=Mycolicibacterium porcinum TaxID=39693 RepID=UPI00080B1C84|nr:hypothetical protein [Mycolicibacterium porcinum]OCB09260.1 hypothetical protein A5717_26150 [Mycolicibacterium porcinum]